MIFMSNKYNAIKQVYKGLKFDSKKELHSIKIGRYTADFKYRNKSGETIIEDVKSKVTKTRDYILRKKILATYNPPIIIKEIL